MTPLSSMFPNHLTSVWFWYNDWLRALRVAFLKGKLLYVCQVCVFTGLSDSVRMLDMWKSCQCFLIFCFCCVECHLLFSCHVFYITFHLLADEYFRECLFSALVPLRIFQKQTEWRDVKWIFISWHKCNRRSVLWVFGSPSSSVHARSDLLYFVKAPIVTVFHRFGDTSNCGSSQMKAVSLMLLFIKKNLPNQT